MNADILTCAQECNLQNGAITHYLILQLPNGDKVAAHIDEESFDRIMVCARGTDSPYPDARPTRDPEEAQQADMVFGGDMEPEQPRPQRIVYADDQGNPIVPQSPQEQVGSDDDELVDSI